MTDIDTSPEAVERLATIDHDIMLMCGTCSDECNCHPPSEMWIRRATGKPICDGCADEAEIPAEDLDHAPDPVRTLRALSARLTAAEAERDRLRAALEMIEAGLPAGSMLLDGQAPLWRDAYRDLQRKARAALAGGGA